MVILSVIIPIYNADKYLRQSLDSILCQKCSDRCEFLLINDGSVDSSRDILLEYSNKYSSIRVINKPNEGVSATRNRGIEEAHGEYIFFMDADDILHPEAMQLIVNQLVENHPDILTWQFSSFYKNPKFMESVSDIKIESISESSQAAFNYLMKSGYAVSLWNKAIRRSLIGDVIRFDVSMTYGEDMFFSWKVILLAKNIIYINNPLYYYRQSGSSAISRYHANLYEKYSAAFSDIAYFMDKNGLLTESNRNDINYHFACRLPALSLMEYRAPYSKQMKIQRLKNIIADDRIACALKYDSRLKGVIYDMAKEENLTGILRKIRIDSLKSRILLPIKRLIK